MNVVLMGSGMGQRCADIKKAAKAACIRLQAILAIILLMN